MAHAPLADSVSDSMLDRLRADRPEAWQRLHHLYAPLVRFWAAQARLQPADADDLCQDVFQAVAAGLPAFDRGRPGATFRGWLRTLTRNKIIDAARRAAARPPGAVGGSTAWHEIQNLPGTADPSDDGAPASPAEADEVAGVWLRAAELVRAEFEPRTWKAFWLMAVEERSAAEAAAELGVSPSAVRLYKSRVLRRLREELGGLEA